MENTKETKETGRREFLIKTGRYAAYASPVILTMLMPRAGVYAQSGLMTSSTPTPPPPFGSPPGPSPTGGTPFGSPPVAP